MRYRCFDTISAPLANGKVLVHSRRTKTTRILSASQAQLLLSCRTFATLREHARARRRDVRQRAAQKATSLRGKLVRWAVNVAAENDQDIPIHSKEIAPLERQLSDFVDDGFLVSESDLLGDLRLAAEGAKDTSESPVRVHALGVATCNRPEYLRRCVTSYLENSRRYDRHINVVIMDDSREDSAIEANRRVLTGLQSDFKSEIFHISRPEREHFARRLARHADVPPETAEFAVLGDARCKTYGAAINAFLLHTTGEAVVISDDDTVCKMAAAPEREQGLTLSSEGDPNEHWFFEDYDSTLESLSFIDRDFFALHEQLLGQRPASCIASAITEGAALRIDDMSPGFLKNSHAPEARVAMSFTGIAGDSGAKNTLYRLFKKGDTFERLVDTPSDYHNRINTHQILRATPQATISDGGFCMATVMGLDNRTLLPPMMPVQQNCEGVFGLLLKVCFSDAYRGFTPCVLLHDPPVHRAPEAGVRQSVKPPRVNDLLQLLVLAFGRQEHAPDSSSHLQRLGDFLTAWGRAPAEEVEDYVRTIYFRELSALLQRTEHRLEENRSTPAYWAEDMKALMSAHEELLAQDHFFVPSDLEGDAATRMVLFRELVHRFGQLLAYWPALVEAAQVLRDNKQGIMMEI